MEQNLLGKSIHALRKRKGLTQSELARMLGVSNQAVSKWESSQCCPDIMLLPVLADLMEVSIDELFGRSVASGRTVIQTLPWEDDNNLRVVCCVGHTLAEQIPVRSSSIELHFSGNVNNIFSEFSVTAENCTIGGNVNAGTGVACGDVSGDVSAGSWIRCGDIGADAAAGNDIQCGNIGGSVTAGSGVRCGTIGGNAFAGGGIHCQSVEGLLDRF